jgi:cyclophilin family peptidyl-prolyl cis-trans isomerase
MRRPLVLLCSVAVVAGLTAGATLAGTHTTGTKTAAAACAKRKQPQPRAPQARKAPTARLDVHKIWLLTFRTSCGTFRVQLLPRTSPRAAASLVSLARSRYFDGTIFHRVVPGFVIQGGDPTQSGSGGPGYITVDTPKTGTRYVTGVVAMAKTTAEPRGASGSQFFVMTADAPSLPPDYAVVGRVVGGLPVVELIGTFGDPADPVGTPTRIVVIDRVTVMSR